jgi:ribA/ribD-fused uncharacterized protein
MVEVNLRIPEITYQRLQAIVATGILGSTMEEVVNHILRQFLWDYKNQVVELEDSSISSAEEYVECHKLDTGSEVFFYEQDFYVLSNFSAFNIFWRGYTFDTSEKAYQWEKFLGACSDTQELIYYARSSHEAFKIAQERNDLRRQNWDKIKVMVMRDILRAKVAQHDYVRKKLLATGNRTLIEDSWRDSFWGWGPNKDGENMLGKLWMKVRDELRALA